ncbi:MAG TPA: ChbG/HpnK family deacetylase [Puia sp.]|nr:ChbG/HpnK family deacetylase [Puia sp.]
MRKLMIVVVFWVMNVGKGFSAQVPLSPLPSVRNGFVVISHRGNHVKVPENTIASIQEAIRVGADYVEIDLRTTKDGYLVLSHDATVDRMTDGKGRVRDLTFEEIERLKVGKDSTIYRVPTFREVLNACKGRMNIYLDFKDADVEETYRQIKAAGMERQVVVYLNKVEQYMQWKKAAPGMPLMSSLPGEIKTPDQFRRWADQARLEVLDNVYDTAMQAVAHEKGIALWLDVESAGEGPALWDKALAWNIQGLQTDHPEALVAYLQQTGRRNGRGISDAGSREVLPAYRKLSDIAYGPDRENIMDAYIPGEYADGKVIVYIHGGGWTGGDKGELPASLIEELTGRRKYIVVSMNYRLVKGGRNIFPAQIEDVGRALKFISDHAKKYHYDGNAFALMGGSAGGHLAMLYAYGYDTARQVKAVVDLWGPTDLSDKAVRAGNKDADSKVVDLLGVADPQAQVCLDASPYYRVSKTSGVPTILFHGEDDPLVDVGQAKKMYQKLLSLGVPAELKVYPHEKHGVGAGAAVDVFSRTLAWLDRYFPPPAMANHISYAGPTYAERLGWPKGSKVIILHVDDAGMSINSNEGAINSIEKGVATSTSIMMPCPWAASFAKYAAEKGYDAGLHLTLTSEWHHYRWGPLAGIKQVPGLTDKEWCLWPEPEDVVQHASADEVETEIRAQLARALALGLHPTHLDSHMGTLFASRAYLERYIKVGIENKIPVMFPGGNNKLLAANMKGGADLLKDAAVVGETIWKAGLPVLDDLVTYSGDWKPQPVDGKISPDAYEKYKVRKLEEAIDSMQPGVAMFIVHSSVVTDDFRHITGSGDSRNADMLAMMDPDLKAYILSKGIILTTWREMMERRQKYGTSFSVR